MTDEHAAWLLARDAYLAASTEKKLSVQDLRDAQEAHDIADAAWNDAWTAFVLAERAFRE